MTEDYSSALIQLFHDAARKRVAKADGEKSLALLQFVRLAYMSAKDEASLAQFKSVVAALETQEPAVKAGNQSAAMARLQAAHRNL